MKKMLMVLFVMLMALTFAYAAANVPATINLKTSWNVSGKQKDVVFKHETHGKNQDCTTCHASADGGKFVPSSAYKLDGGKYNAAGGAKLEFKGMNDKNAAHAFCWTCHAEKKVSVGKTCTKCHTGV